MNKTKLILELFDKLCECGNRLYKKLGSRKAVDEHPEYQEIRKQIKAVKAM